MTLGPFGAALYQQVLPMHGPDDDGLVEDYIGAVTLANEEIDSYVRDTDDGPGWSVLLDADAAPVKGLPWLAQLVGVSLRGRRMIRTDNLAPNPGVEGTNLASFTGVNATISRVAAPSGGFMLRATATAGGTVGVYVTIDVLSYPTNIYTGSVDVIAASSHPVQLQMLLVDNIGSTLTTVSGTASSTLGRRSLTANLPVAGSFLADSARFRVLMTGASIGDTLDLDLFAVRPDTSSDYLDGNSTGGAWLGTPNDSESRVLTAETDEAWEAYARDAIKRQGGRQRGTLDAQRSAVEDTLVGTRYVNLLERVGGDPYAMTLVTRISETPKPLDTLAAWLTQKPAGIVPTHVLTFGAIIDEGTRTIDAGTATIDAATLADVT